jgi:hypothetical protein
MKSKKYNNFNFYFSFILLLLSLLLIFQINTDLDLESLFFNNVDAIEINNNNNNYDDKLEDLDQFDYIFNARDYYEEDPVAQSTSNTKNSTIKEGEVKSYNSTQKSNNNNISTPNNIYNNNEKKNSQVLIQLLRNIYTNSPIAFNFVAVGDWDCTSETKDTADNIIDQNQNWF